MRPSVAVEESLRVLGRNIKIARLKRRVPQEVLAERAGIGLSTLTKIEKAIAGWPSGQWLPSYRRWGWDCPSRKF